MAAPVVTTHIQSDSFEKTRRVYTATFTDTQVSAATIFDLSALKFADSAEGTVHQCVIDSVDWHISGTGSIAVILSASPDFTALNLSGHGKFSGGQLSAAGGDVKVTTTGMASGSSLTLDITISKVAGYVNVPVAGDAEITNEIEETPVEHFVTGDVITATVEFSSGVTVKGVPVLEIISDSGEDPVTYNMLCVNSQTSASNLVTFAYRVQAEDNCEEGDLDFGDMVLSGNAAIKGGFADSLARITGFVGDDLSGYSVNAAPVVESVELSDDHAGVYVTEDVIQVLVTMSKAVTVTGSPFVELTIDSNTREAVFVGYGEDHTELLFEYEVIAGDGAAATEFEITGSIDLDGGTITASDATVNAVLTLANVDTMTAVTVND